MRRRAVVIMSVLVTLFLSGTTALAQAIRGVVVDVGDRPVGGVVVQMLDSASNVAARALSNERGEFRVAASRAGVYRLRTLRIGFKPATSDATTLLAGGEVTQRLVLSGVQLVLDTVRVVDRNSCRFTSDSSAAATFAVWEQARTALTATQITAVARVIMATTVAYTRTFEPDARRVLEQASKLRTDFVTQPWRALSPDSLRRAGYIVTERDNSLTYHAPGIDVLLSNVFVEDHCFRLTTDRNRAGMIGIAFEPTPERRRLPEIRGTIWVDRKSSELRRMDYRYANATPEQESVGAGGELEFARMANGGWAISRWNIRMPVLDQTMATRALGGVQNHIVGISVTGGELVLATILAGQKRDTIWSRPPLVLAGSVVDSVSGQAVAGARVAITGTVLEGVADARGRFSIAGVLPGVYTLETRTSSLDAVGALNRSAVSFTDSSVTVQIRVPSAAQIGTALCGEARVGAGAGMIVGTVVSRGDSIPQKGTSVVAEWLVESPDEPGGAANKQGRRITAYTDVRGAYRICGVPINTALSLRAVGDSAVSQPTGARITDGRFARVDLTMGEKVQPGAVFRGVVLTDSTKAPILGAEVTLPALAQTTFTDRAGSFRLSGIPAGEQQVIVRRLGYGALDTKVTFGERATVDRTIFLSSAVTLNTVVVAAQRVDQIMREFEDNRHRGIGHFLTRADLAKLESVKLGAILAELPGAAVLRGVGGRGWVYSSRNTRCMPSFPNLPGCDEAHNVYTPNLIEARQGMQKNCYARVYLDDILLTPGRPTEPFDVSSLPVESIEAIEYYASPAETPLRYSTGDTNCGVVVIHQRRSP